jgi:hypothetical protein
LALLLLLLVLPLLITLLLPYANLLRAMATLMMASRSNDGGRC